MYNGYSVKIGGAIVDPSIIVKGSYQATQDRIVAGSWRDANGKMHYSFFPEPKMTISFSIQKRTKEQQRSIQHLFLNKDNLEVEYYDDVTEDYKNIVCKMDDIVFKHQYDCQDNMFFDDTEIVLREY